MELQHENGTKKSCGEPMSLYAPFSVFDTIHDVRKWVDKTKYPASLVGVLAGSVPAVSALADDFKRTAVLA